jgi:hypothetical protein
VSQILQAEWKFLTDEQFQKVSLKKHIQFWNVKICYTLYHCWRLK